MALPNFNQLMTPTPMQEPQKLPEISKPTVDPFPYQIPTMGESALGGQRAAYENQSINIANQTSRLQQEVMKSIFGIGQEYKKTQQDLQSVRGAKQNWELAGEKMGINHERANLDLEEWKLHNRNASPEEIAMKEQQIKAAQKQEKERYETTGKMIDYTHSDLAKKATQLDAVGNKILQEIKNNPQLMSIVTGQGKTPEEVALFQQNAQAGLNQPQVQQAPAPQYQPGQGMPQFSQVEQGQVPEPQTWSDKMQAIREQGVNPEWALGKKGAELFYVGDVSKPLSDKDRAAIRLIEARIQQMTGKGQSLPPSLQKVKDAKTVELIDTMTMNKEKNSSIQDAIEASKRIKGGIYGKIERGILNLAGADDPILEDWQKIKMVLTDAQLLKTAQTKGAISDKEMALFASAAANDDITSVAKMRPVFDKLMRFMQAEEKSQKASYKRIYGEDPDTWFQEGTEYAPEEGQGEDAEFEEYLRLIEG